MANKLTRTYGWSWTAALVPVIAVLIMGDSAWAQMKDADAQGMGAIKGQPLLELAQPRMMSLIHNGYTRPGFPNDTIQDGKVLALAWDDTFSGRFMGGTVYFAVYERSAEPVFGDVFGTGFAGIDELFREGRSNDSRYSPAYDINARFLYVYQVVNDRGLNPRKELASGASGRELRSEDIVTATVKLLVDPREITSWGHFSKAGFTATIADRDLAGAEQKAAEGKGVRTLPLAFSSNPSVLDALRFPEYLSLAPSVSLHALRNGFTIERSDLNLNKSRANQQLTDVKTKGGALAGWQQNMLVAANGGMEPSYVQVNMASYFEPFGGYPFDFDGSPMLQAPGQNPARGYFRVDWTGDQVLKVGEHSVIFGFTSNCPPAEEAVRLVSAAMPGAGKEVLGTAFVDAHGIGAGVGQVVGTGTVPTPACFCEQPSVGGGWLGGFMGGGGVAAGAFAGGGGFGFAGPRAPIIGGGGGGGGGGGDQNQSQFQKQKQEQDQDQKQDQDGGKGHGGGHGDCNVVPEPAAIALGLLGLPAICVMLRRRRSAIQPA